MNNILLNTNYSLSFFLLIILLFGLGSCKSFNHYDDIFQESCKVSLEAIKHDSVNKDKSVKIIDNNVSEQIISITNDFYSVVDSINWKLIISSGGYKFSETISTQLAHPDNYNSVQQIMIEEKGELLIKLLIDQHQIMIENILTEAMLSKSDVELFVNNEYINLKEHIVSFQGVAVSEALLKLALLRKSERELIGEVIDELIEQ